MKRSPQKTTRAGYTLIELLLAIAASTILIAGMSSTMYVALQASGSSKTSHRHRMESIDALSQIASDLQYATSVTESLSHSVTFNVPDRNYNGSEETIEYTWGQNAGSAITMKYNGSTAENLVDSVESFSLTPISKNSKIVRFDLEIQTTSDSSTRYRLSVPTINFPDEP